MNSIGTARAPDITNTGKVVYNAGAYIADSRDGGAPRISDDRLAIKLSMPMGPGSCPYSVTHRGNIDVVITLA